SHGSRRTPTRLRPRPQIGSRHAAAGQSPEGKGAPTMTTKQDKKGVSRRAVLKGAAATAGAALGSGAITGFPTIWAQNIKDVTLRQFGTGVSNRNDGAKKVKEDLGFTLEMTALDSDSVTQRAATQPDSFDIADIE